MPGNMAVDSCSRACGMWHSQHILPTGTFLYLSRRCDECLPTSMWWCFGQHWPRLSSCFWLHCKRISKNGLLTRVFICLLNTKAIYVLNTYSVIKGIPFFTQSLQCSAVLVSFPLTFSPPWPPPTPRPQRGNLFLHSKKCELLLQK